MLLEFSPILKAQSETVPGLHAYGVRQLSGIICLAGQLADSSQPSTGRLTASREFTLSLPKGMI